MGYKPDFAMKEAYSDIRLNGKPYNGLTLLRLCNDKKWLSSADPATVKIFQFIAEWLNKQDHITLSTSGSTGEPKKIRLLKNHMIQSALLTQHLFDLNEDKTALLCMPVEYIAGKMMIVRAFVTGYNLITIPPSANPFKHVGQAIDFTALTPYQLYHSLEDIRRLNIRQIIVGGGEISPELEKKIKDMAAEIFAAFGMTETCSHVALRKANGSDATDIYTALEGISFLLDERECLVIDAPMLSAKKIVTNDAVELIDNKHFRWLGRYDNVINTGGIKVYPEAVEKKISGLVNRPFFISSLSDSELSEKVVIVVEGTRLKKNQENRLMQQFGSSLGRYEIPKAFLYVEKFIFAKSGKILRKKSLEKYH
jgi:O-succinylbenzoic acid--CoA ligase